MVRADDHLHLAPPKKIVDGLLAVPIDIRHVEAYTVFDMSTSKARVTASMNFIMGNTDGYPFFDLRQNIA